MRIPLYFSLIFRKLFLLFILIHTSLLCSYFFLEFITLSSTPNISKLFLHFLSLSLSKSDFFITFSFLLAAIQTIQSLKSHGELTALQANGISTLRISLPFLLTATLLATFSYWNYEVGIPNAHIWKIHALHKRKSTEAPPFLIKQLPDHTKIIYQEYDKEIHDLYWIISQNEIWHCKNIVRSENQYVGHFVDKLSKNPLGRFEKSESFPSYSLPFSLDNNIEPLSAPEKSPLSRIFSLLRDDSLIISQDRAKFITCLLYKIINPWFPLFALLGILAFLLPGKIQNTYFSFLIGIFCYLLFYSMMKTFTILGESYFISPWLTMLLIPIGIGTTFTYRLCKK